MPREYTPEETQAIVALQDALYSDPETRPQFQRLVKKKFPKAHIPEVDLLEQTSASVKPVIDRLDKMEATIETDRRSRQIEDEWHRQHVTPAERTEIEKLMTDRLIGDVGTAVEYYRGTQRQAAAAPRSGPSTLSMPTGEGFKGLFENPTKWGRDTAYAAIGELQQQRT